MDIAVKEEIMVITTRKTCDITKSTPGASGKFIMNCPGINISQIIGSLIMAEQSHKRPKKISAEDEKTLNQASVSPPLAFHNPLSNSLSANQGDAWENAFGIA